MENNDEPEIIINGVRCTEGMAMTLRVAITMFSHDINTNGLGDDEHGKKMVSGYNAQVSAIFKLMRLNEKKDAD